MRRATIGALFFALLAAGVMHAQEPDAKTTEKSIAAFRDVAKVLRHPRCLNCHPSGDRPRVGDAAKIHLQNVQRGRWNRGVPGMRCSTCHRTENQDLAGIPGAPHWSLAPRSMGWEGLDDHDLAEALKDKKRNRNRSLADLLKHVREDPLVLWGWMPDRGRAAVPMPHDTFVAAFKTWIETGAVSPPKGEGR